ncbi:MAG: tetratricopeptide repeat protein [Parvularculaceae bacterium]|nr:tetratricopeptide repeat protein [Parvularculaceae bacterium]
MIAASLFALAALAQSTPTFGGEVCSPSEGPEVGVGILCDRARIAIDARELTVARDLATTASDLAPSYPGVWIVRAEVERLGRRLDKARDLYEKAAALEPENPAILIMMGDFEAGEGNVRGAALLYERAFDIDANYPGLGERLDAVTDDAPSSSEI